MGSLGGLMKMIPVMNLSFVLLALLGVIVTVRADYGPEALADEVTNLPGVPQSSKPFRVLIRPLRWRV